MEADHELGMVVRYDDMEQCLQEHAEKFRVVLAEISRLARDEDEGPRTWTPQGSAARDWKMDGLIEMSMDLAASLEQMGRDKAGARLHQYNHEP